MAARKALFKDCVTPMKSNMTAAATKELTALSTSEAVKDVLRSLGGKYSGAGRATSQAFLLFTTTLLFTLGEVHSAFEELININRSAPELGFSEIANIKLFKILFQVCEDEAQGVVSQFLETLDGRRALLALAKKFRPTSIVQRAVLKRTIANMGIDCSKSPTAKINELLQMFEVMNGLTIVGYSEEERVTDLLGALTSDFSELLTMYDITGAELELRPLISAIEDVYTRKALALRQKSASAMGSQATYAAVWSQRKYETPRTVKDDKSDLPPVCKLCDDTTRYFFAKCPIIIEAAELKARKRGETVNTGTGVLAPITYAAAARQLAHTAQIKEVLGRRDYEIDI